MLKIIRIQLNANIIHTIFFAISATVRTIVTTISSPIASTIVFGIETPDIA